MNNLVQEKAQEIIMRETMKSIADTTLADLIGLYGDIRVELSAKSPDNQNLIDDYTELLKKEQKVCSPENAYQAGREAAQSGQKCNAMEYLKTVYTTPEYFSFYNELEKVFRSICDILGETHGLVSEYTEVYRQFYGTINRIIHVFYEWGYHGTMPDYEQEAC